MKESLFIWIRNVAYYMIMVTAIMHLVPNGSYQKYIRLFTGMILILLLSMPVIRLFGVDPEGMVLINLEEYEDRITEIEGETMYLYDVDVSEYMEDEYSEEIVTENIKIEKIEIGE